MKTISKFIIVLAVLFAFSLPAFARNKGSGHKYEAWNFLYEDKCSKCHSLGMVFADTKTENEWRVCVRRMMRKNPFWITYGEGEQIIAEIIGARSESVAPFHQKHWYDRAELLFIDRCSKCHEINEILCEEKTKEEWKKTVVNMRNKAPELFKDKDIPIIADFLAKRGKLLHENISAKIMVNKCLICHEWDRMLLERKSKNDWEICVQRMKELAKRNLNIDLLTKHEEHAIVSLLVRTQGLDN